MNRTLNWDDQIFALHFFLPKAMFLSRAKYHHFVSSQGQLAYKMAEKKKKKAVKKMRKPMMVAVRQIRGKSFFTTLPDQ